MSLRSKERPRNKKKVGVSGALDEFEVPRITLIMLGPEPQIIIIFMTLIRKFINPFKMI